MNMNITQMSTIIIMIFVIFLLLLFIRANHPKILTNLRDVTYKNWLVTLILLASIVFVTLKNDAEQGMYGVIGLFAILFLCFMMSYQLEEHFKDDDAKNLLIRKLELIKSVMDSVESAENGFSSLPGKHHEEIRELKSITFKLNEMMKDVKMSEKKEDFKNKHHKHHQHHQHHKHHLTNKFDSVVKVIHTKIRHMKHKDKACDTKLMRSFLTYVLSENPSIFFEGSDSKLYRKRASAIYHLLKKRQEFGYNTLTLELICAEKHPDGYSGLKVQHHIHHPEEILKTLHHSFSKNDKSEAAEKEHIENEIIRMMKYLSDSRTSKKAKTNIYVLV